MYVYHGSPIIVPILEPRKPDGEDNHWQPIGVYTSDSFQFATMFGKFIATINIDETDSRILVYCLTEFINNYRYLKDIPPSVIPKPISLNEYLNHKPRGYYNEIVLPFSVEPERWIKI